MTQFSKATAALCAALIAGGATLATAPKPAVADATSTGILAGLAGILIGSLLFDSSRHQYYYVRAGHRFYVNDDQARTYYQHKDPSYFNAHRSTFSSNHQAFAKQWNNDHAHGNAHGGAHGDDRHR